MRSISEYKFLDARYLRSKQTECKKLFSATEVLNQHEAAANNKNGNAVATFGKISAIY